MSSYRQYMIDNYRNASLVTCSETHNLHMPVPICTISANSRQKKTWSSSTKLNYMDYIERLTGMKTNDSWRCHKTVKPGVNLWSRVLIYNRPTRERITEVSKYVKRPTRYSFIHFFIATNVKRIRRYI